jgi:hypothetical protein
MRDAQPKPSRRGFMMGAAVAGAATTAVVALPTLQQHAKPAVSEQPAPPERGGGYRLSEHVKHYYRTTLV